MDKLPTLRQLMLAKQRIEQMLWQYINQASPGGSLNPELTPENIRQAGEFAAMTPNPIGDVASGMLAVDDLRQGDYLGAAGNALGVIPFVPALGTALRQGAGLKLYRGTAGRGHDFSDPNRLGGIFFTNDKAYAQQMAERSARKYGGEPKVDVFEVDYGRMAPPGMSIQKAKERGYDSSMAGNEVIIFDKTRIKNYKDYE